LEPILNLPQFLDLLNDSSRQVEFDDSIALIDSLYQFTPTAFRNGDAVSSADQNFGSCKILSFGQIQQFDVQQTLRCFGDFYQGVIDTPEGDDHQNIRQFMLHGWNGVVFEGSALTAFSSPSKSTGGDSSNIVAELESEFVELFKILKFEGLAHSGGFAKQVIADGLVCVNGEVETQKRKKIVAGDKILFDGQAIDVTLKSS
jgi:ribosome-associated protein YbcJ (S4-like RNA binding protein)